VLCCVAVVEGKGKAEWCNIRASAGGMLVLWRNAEKGAASLWVEDAALEASVWGFCVFCRTWVAAVFEADLP
jgi:hypothetical protein